jgi:beta-barrel assembly-enhancing protease
MRAILLLAAVSAALAQAPAQGVNFFSIEKEIELGKSLAAAFQAKEPAQPDARLQAIGDRLAAKTDGTFQYRFFVYPQVGPQYEPVALPGGPVFVAQSAITSDDAEMAAILAHAIAHIALRHYTREQTQRELMEIGRKAAGVRVFPDDDPVQRASRSFRPPMATGFELDADRFAVKLLIDAGYDPQALVRWLQSFPVATANLAIGDLPTPSRRVAAAQKAIEAAR